MSNYRVIFTDAAAADFGAIKDNTVRDTIVRRIRRLESDPRGQPLRNDLAGHFSVRAAGHRIVFRVDHSEVVVTVVTVAARHAGKRDDAYTKTRRR